MHSVTCVRKNSDQQHNLRYATHRRRIHSLLDHASYKPPVQIFDLLVGPHHPFLGNVTKLTAPAEILSLIYSNSLSRVENGFPLDAIECFPRSPVSEGSTRQGPPSGLSRLPYLGRWPADPKRLRSPLGDAFLNVMLTPHS